MPELFTILTLGAILFYPSGKSDTKGEGNKNPIIKIGM